MSGTTLNTVLRAVDWNGNVNEFVSDVASVAQVEKAVQRLAIWSLQLERVDADNPALCFIREMQASAHLVAVCTALGIYKGAASGMRTMVETALYYSYFRVHLVELPTLLRNEKWYISKGDVLEFHSLHTERFNEIQGKLGLVGDLNAWYSRISAVIHGQIPGNWLSPSGISAFKPDIKTRLEALQMFIKGEELVHRLFLATVGRENWESFSTSAKSALLKSMSGDVRSFIGLDTA